MLSDEFKSFLLATHLVLLLVFLFGKWSHLSMGLGAWLREIRLNEFGNTSAKKLDPRFVALSMFACNMIGIICLKSMHHQFYAWYHQTMPLILLFTDDVPMKYKIIIYAVIEVSINRNPHVIYSLGLFFGHASLILFSFFKTKYPSPYLQLKVKD